MVIVDDHLALLALAGRLPELGLGPVATTYCFHYRIARAVSGSRRSGTLSRRLADPKTALERVMRPPADRLVVLDPRQSIHRAVAVADTEPANLLLAELVGAAVHHGAAVRVTPENTGRGWPQIMAGAGVDFGNVRI